MSILLFHFKFGLFFKSALTLFFNSSLNLLFIYFCHWLQAIFSPFSPHPFLWTLFYLSLFSLTSTSTATRMGLQLSVSWLKKPVSSHWQVTSLADFSICHANSRFMKKQLLLSFFSITSLKTVRWVGSFYNQIEIHVIAPESGCAQRVWSHQGLS